VAPSADAQQSTSARTDDARGRRLGHPARLACVINGYAKDGDAYLRNARMRDVTVETDVRHVAGTLTDLPPEESHQFQDLPLPKGRTSLVSVTITSFYSGISNNGLRAYLDLCVSEVMLDRMRH
jgi:hypothetical protein